MGRRSVPCGVLALLVGVALNVGCQPQGGGSTSPRPAAASRAVGGEPVPPPTLDELENGTYRGLEEPAGPVTLVDGRWEGEPAVPGGASRPVVTMVRDFHVTGDLDGDGVDEAVVALSRSSGGSGTFLYLAVVDRRQGGIDNVATRLVGDRVQVREAGVEEGRLVLRLVEAGPGDAMCCPGELVTRTWEVRQGVLDEVGEPVSTGRLGLDTLQGPEWVLRSWSWDEPAAADPEVTLVVEEGGRVAGSNGCNRYFAQATSGEGPGAIFLGPTGSTKRFCPDPAGAVESRFMTRLAGVSKLGFTMGRLMLSYEVDGEPGVMLFEPRTPPVDPGP